jgi:hypothetical protein
MGEDAKGQDGMKGVDRTKVFVFFVADIAQYGPQTTDQCERIVERGDPVDRLVVGNI